MHHVLASFIVLIMTFGIMVALRGKFHPHERLLVWGGYAAHVVSAFALLAVYTFFYGGAGDIFAYERFALDVTEVVRTEPLSYASDLIRSFFHLESRLDPYLYSPGSPTGAMATATSIAFLFLFDSLIGSCLLFAFLAFSGKLAIYMAFRREFHPLLHQRLLVAFLLIPSAVFWTAGVVKESLAVFGLGWAIYGLVICSERGIFSRGLIPFTIGSIFIFAIKPYIALPLGIGAGVYYVLKRIKATPQTSGSTLKKPLYLIGGLGISFVFFTLVTTLFPRFSISSVAEEAARLQSYGTRGVGGSTFNIGSGEATTLVSQLAFAPLALVNTFFRPFLFEAHNAVALVNALETSALTLFLLITLKARGFRGTVKGLLASPPLAFFFIFSILFGLGVGLGTTNLGTLSRYRVPLIPMYAAILLVLLPLRKSEMTH